MGISASSLVIDANCPPGRERIFFSLVQLVAIRRTRPMGKRSAGEHNLYWAEAPHEQQGIKLNV